MLTRQVLHEVITAILIMVLIGTTQFVSAAHVTSKNTFMLDPSYPIKLKPSYTLAFSPEENATQPEYERQLIHFEKRVVQSTDLPKIQLALLDRMENKFYGPRINEYMPETEVLALVEKDQKTQQKVPLALAEKVKVGEPEYGNQDMRAGVWEMNLSDQTLNAVLVRWAVRAGWQLQWDLPVDYAIEANTSMSGSFEQVIETVARSMESAEIPLKAIFYKGNKVLRIVQKGPK